MLGIAYFPEILSLGGGLGYTGHKECVTRVCGWLFPS
jgi:hypothetical protein